MGNTLKTLRRIRSYTQSNICQKHKCLLIFFCILSLSYGQIAVFCNLQLLKIQLRHNINKESMGSCLSTQEKYIQNLPNTNSNQSSQLRTEIIKQLNQTYISQPSMPQQPKISTIAEVKFTAEIKNGEISTPFQGQAIIIPQRNSKNFRKQQNPQINRGQTMQNKALLCDLANEANQKQKEKKSEQHEECSRSDQTEENEQDDEKTETFPLENRASQSSSNELGNGLSQAHNKLIALSLNTEVPIKLPRVKLLNNSTYQGQWLQGKGQGYGVVQRQDGSSYQGQWHKNCSHGKGKLTYANAAVYQGDFFMNKAQGIGVCTYPDGSVYEGEWKNNEREGKGILLWKDGERYEGQWVAGKKQGQGKLHFRDGSFYRGQFSCNQIHGHGFYCWLNSREYEGEWQHNQMSGWGKLKWANGQLYQGYFLNSKYQGEGTLITAEGTSAGHWQKGRKNGVFQERDGSGKVSQVEWHHGKRLKLAQDNKKGHEERMPSAVTHSF